MTEQAPAPDESKFNAMQAQAAAQGPEAEARRQEMADWSELQGQMAEQAHKEHIAAVRPVDSKHNVTVGVRVTDTDGEAVLAMPTKKGISVTPAVSAWEKKDLKSPAEMAK